MMKPDFQVGRSIKKEDGKLIQVMFDHSIRYQYPLPPPSHTIKCCELFFLAELWVPIWTKEKFCSVECEAWARALNSTIPATQVRLLGEILDKARKDSKW